MVIESRKSGKEREVGVDLLYVNNRRVGFTCRHCGTAKMKMLYKLRGRIAGYLISKGVLEVGGRSK
jgi:hypothetical protein